MDKRCDDSTPQNAAKSKRHQKTDEAPLRRRGRFPLADRFVQPMLKQQFHTSVTALSSRGSRSAKEIGTGGGQTEVTANCAKATPTLDIGRNVSTDYVYKLAYMGL